MQRNIVLLFVVLYGCETWSLANEVIAIHDIPFLKKMCVKTQTVNRMIIIVRGRNYFNKHVAYIGGQERCIQGYGGET
jgi:hypothetical protein